MDPSGFKPNRRSRSASSLRPCLISRSASVMAAAPSPAAARARSPSRSPRSASRPAAPPVAGVGPGAQPVQVPALGQQPGQPPGGPPFAGVGPGARVRRGYYVDLSDFPDGLGGQVQVRVSTRWEDLGLDYPVPRELWMAIRCTAPRPGGQACRSPDQPAIRSAGRARRSFFRQHRPGGRERGLLRQVNVHGPPRITRASSTAIVSDVIAM
jgi:hypothetical protein